MTARPRSATPRPPPSSFSFQPCPDPLFRRVSSRSPQFMAYYRASSPSTHSFRAPFLSPASRSHSSLWSPPSHSSLALPLKSSRSINPSTRLPQKLSREEKPWLSIPDPGRRYSWWITFTCFLLGIGGAAALCYLGATEAHKLTPDQLCLVFDDEFSSGNLDDSIWTPEVQLGLSTGSSVTGLPSEFSMTTSSPANLHLTNNQLYITPTLTTEQSPDLNLFNGNFTLPDCTAANKSTSAYCNVNANPILGTVINPVQSARITTKGKKQLKYGRVEIRAKLPVGDWLWPSITLHPSSPVYFPAFPASGQITLLSSRGNSPLTYNSNYSPPSSSSSSNHTSPPPSSHTKFGSSNSITSSLSYAPLASLYHQILGTYTTPKRLPTSLTGDFHTYVLEWDQNWMRLYIDSRLNSVLDVDVGGKGKKSLWDLGGFPSTAVNSSETSGGGTTTPQNGGGGGGEDDLVAVQNPYSNAGKNAPFDQPFYLSIQLAAGGTSGWFPDGVGAKPWWDDDTKDAMKDFANAQEEWSKTWNDDGKSFRIDYVKVWEKCR